MTTMTPHDVIGRGARHLERRRRLHDERRFRVEQLDALAMESASSGPHASVNDALYLAATATLREIDAALARMDAGRYGLCLACSQPLPDSRLDVLPMAALCISCDYTQQTCRTASGQVRQPDGRHPARR